MLGNCTPKETKEKDQENSISKIEEPDAMTLSKSMPKEQVFTLLDMKVNHYMEIG